MLLYTSPLEGLAWLEGDDEDWARHYTVEVHSSELREDEADDRTA